MSVKHTPTASVSFRASCWASPSTDCCHTQFKEHPWAWWLLSLFGPVYLDLTADDFNTADEQVARNTLGISVMFASETILCMFTSTKEVMFSSASVCLLVCQQKKVMNWFWQKLVEGWLVHMQTQGWIEEFKKEMWFDLFVNLKI